VCAAEPLRFGLTPVFVDSDLQLLRSLHAYLVAQTGRPVELVQRRTYQEITALLLSDQIDAAWICGFPYVRWRDRLSLLAVPVYLGRPLYQSYIIVGRDRAVARFEDLKADIHAFSDPDSNSGWLVTRHLLLEHGTTPAAFFMRQPGLRAVPSLMYLNDVPQFTEHYFESDDEATKASTMGRQAVSPGTVA
jgi:phosphonate transport system substrate-binding protein